MLALAAAAFAAGLLLAWPLARRRSAPDSAEEGRWQLEMASLREEATTAVASARHATREADFLREEQRRTLEHLKSLEEQVAHYVRQYAQVKDILKKEILQKGSLKAELAGSLAEVEALRGRISELELERTATNLRRSLSA